MGCGNNKVSRSYLTSQPITTPSARATRASVADLGAQILRLAGEEMKDTARRAEKARKARADDANKAAAMAAATQASDAAADSKTRERQQEAEEVEEAKRLLINSAFRVALEPLRLPGQPEKTVQNIHGEDREIKSWVRRVGEDGSYHELRDADGSYTHGPLHVHSIVEPTGHVVLIATDRRQNTGDPHVAKITISIPYPPDAMYDAAFDVIADLLRGRA